MNVIKNITEQEPENIIFAGDFNLVLNEKKDAMNRKHNNEKALKVLQAYIEEVSMVDIWRQCNSDQFKFTWHRKKPQHTFARLDFFLINCGLVLSVEQCEILPAF